MKRIIIRLSAGSVLLAAQTIATAADTHPITNINPPALILAVDLSEFADAIRLDTYSSLFGQQNTVTPTNTAESVGTAKLKKVSRTLKRLTSVRYGKQQKIRAKVGKSSLTFKYTRIL